MPDVTITAPVAADSVDRLALAASDARVPGAGVHPLSCAGGCYACICACMSEE